MKPKTIQTGNYFYFLFSVAFLISNFFVECSKSKPKHKYATLPEVYSYQSPTRRVNFDGYESDLDIISTSSTSSDSNSSKDARKNSENPKGDHKRISLDSSSSSYLEEYIDTAVSGGAIEWEALPESEMPLRKASDEISAHFTYINVPILYENDVETKYGLFEDYVKRSFFAIYVRRYHWGKLDRSKPIKHVIFVAGGPGESGRSWTTKLSKLSRQYSRANLIFYVADHRGVFKSRDVVQLITKETERGQTRTSWKRIRRDEHVSEEHWISDIREFEKQVGYPLVAMSCSNAARDLALISLVIRRHLTHPGEDRFYLHAQSYGTQVSTRTLVLLPNFYDGVLLEGLATMEIVKESAKSDFGILSSCAEDRKCSQLFSKTPSRRDLLPLTGPFDLKKLLEGMAQKSHNKQCRDVFLGSMREYVYSESTSFWGAIHFLFYELLADDFLNTFTGSSGNFYPGMLVLPLIRDMYYCEDVERFRRQVMKVIEVVAISVRGLNRPYVKTPSKSKPGDSTQVRSHFVQTYINAHEAFDMRGMKRPSERGYCDRPNQSDLVNQCLIWKEQENRMKVLKALSGTPDLLRTSATVVSHVPAKKHGNKKKKDKINLFEGRYEQNGSEYEGRMKSSSSSESSSDSDVEESVHKSMLFTFKDGKKSKHHRSKKHKKSRKSNRKLNTKKQSEVSVSKLFTWISKNPKAEDFVNTADKSKHVKDTKAEGKRKEDSPIRSGSKGTGLISQNSLHRKYYYDVESDELAYVIPRTEKTRIFVSVGSLDVKTPLLEARRLLAQIEAPFKGLFELKNVAHSTEPCRGQIIRAMTAEGREEQRITLAIADECVRALADERKLDWQLEEVQNIPREDWIP